MIAYYAILSIFNVLPKGVADPYSLPACQLSGTNIRRHAGTFMRMSVKEGEAGTDQLFECSRIPEGHPPLERIRM